MNKLIRAGIKRLFWIKTLYICLAVLFFVDGLDIIKEFLFREPGTDLPDPHGYLISGFLIIVLLAAVFITSFLGSEYQYGTLRNKLAVGYERKEIYLSSFIVCYSAVMLMYAFVWLMTSILGTLMLGGYKNSAKELLILALISFLGFTALTALFVMIGLCVQSKSLGSVTAVIGAFVIMICGVMMLELLSAPEYLPVERIAASELSNYERVPDDPGLVFNPDYIGGSRRRTFQIIYDLCPISQMIAASGKTDAKALLIPVAETAVLMAGGMLIFKKRDLK